MTVSSTVFRNDYTGNGVTTAFTGGFRILDEAHIQVLRTQISTGAVTTLALTTDYTVSGVGGSTFTVTALTAPTSDQRLSILRDVPLTQETDYVEGDPFPAASHETALDKLTMVAQQQQEQLDRSVTLSANSTGVDAELPTPTALNVLGWNGAADALINYDPSSLAGGVAIVNWSSDTFDGDGSTLDFTLSGAPGSVANTDVSVAGVVQRPDIDYTLTGVTLSFIVAPSVGTDNVLVRYGTTVPTGTPGDGTVTAVKLAANAVTTAKVADANITYAKIQNVTDARLLGRSAGSSGSAQEITIAGGLSLSSAVLSALFRGTIDGLVLSTAGSSTTMSIAAGLASDSTNAVLMALAASLNKTTSAWAVGSGNGGKLSAAAIANNTWYYFYLIRRPDTGVVDVGFDVSATTPTLPTNYTQYRYIGAGLTNGSAQWVQFVQDGDLFKWFTPVLDVNVTSAGTSAVLRTLTVPRRRVQAIFNVRVAAGTASGEALYVSDPSVQDQAPAGTASPLSQFVEVTSGNAVAGQVTCFTNTSAQVRTRCANGSASDALLMATVGWLDSRGKDA